MTVNPGFGGQKFIPSMVDKIRKLVTMRNAKGARFRIEVDGGIDLTTVGSVVRAGAELLVAGSAVFSKGDIARNARELLKAAQESVLQQA